MKHKINTIAGIWACCWSRRERAHWTRAIPTKPTTCSRYNRRLSIRPSEPSQPLPLTFDPSPFTLHPHPVLPLPLCPFVSLSLCLSVSRSLLRILIRSGVLASAAAVLGLVSVALLVLVVLMVQGSLVYRVVVRVEVFRRHGVLTYLPTRTTTQRVRVRVCPCACA